MPDVSKRAPGRKDVLSALKVCPYCLGDLEPLGAAGQGHYACLQCGAHNLPPEKPRRLSMPMIQTPGSLMSANALHNRTPS